MSVLATCLSAGCSQDEIAPNEEDVGNGEANTSYLAVNLVSSDVMGTRAADGYEDGSELENFVTNVPFLFLHPENGAVANVKLKGSSYVNYYDWTPSQEDGNKDQTSGTIDTDDIESKLKATIVISTKNGDKLPQKIAAVLNPAGLDDSPKSLSALKDVTADYAASGLTQKGKFVMFNSVYGNNNKTAEICAVPITSENLKKTETEAKDNPLPSMLNEALAKVEVALGNNVKSLADKLALTDKDGNDLKVEGEQVYLQLSNWGLTAVTTNGRLVKKINLTGWTSDWWNGTHRSFWAMNSSTATNDYDTYNNIKTSMSVALYTNENAAAYVNTSDQTFEIEKTKVILKGTLCKLDGTPFTIVRHVGSHFADSYSETPSESFPNLKKSILDQLEITGNNYYRKEGSTFKKITVSDLQIVTPELEEEENSGNNCYVYAQLTENAKKETWYSSQEDDAQPLNNAATVINNSLKTQVDKALVWKSGMTYYYYPIKHLGNTTGVVRNHWYKTTVTKIVGLGTPVYNPEEKIYPEKPDPNEHYIAAEIKILSWRIVNSDNELEW